MKNTIDDATPEEWTEADRANHAASVRETRDPRAMQGVAAVATGSVAGDQRPQPEFERCRDLEVAPDCPRSERLAFMLGWRWAEKGRPRTPNPFAGIDRDLELMWDAGWHEGEPQNIAIRHGEDGISQSRET